jgi:hypothetical protein
MQAPLLLNADEAARLLSMIPGRVSRLAKLGLLPCVELPDGEVRFVEEDLREWVRTHRQPVTDAEATR